MFGSWAGICKKVPGIIYSLLLLKAHQTVLLLGKESIFLSLIRAFTYFFYSLKHCLQAFVHNVDGLKTRFQMSLCLDSRGEVWGEYLEDLNENINKVVILSLTLL